MARKNILNPAAKPQATPRSKEPMMPRGAVGALQSSLSKLQENAIQDLDPNVIDDAGMTDRLGMDSAADDQLRDSLDAHGQQVPILVRPHPSKPGRYEVVYGRRRLRALSSLGRPVKAMVRQLDDHALVLAQGQENSARQDLSFIERASFCAQLDAAGYDRTTIAAALSMDLPMVSRMLKVGRAFDLAFLQKIGAAPGIGRERWMRLVDLMKAPDARGRVHARMNTPDLTGTSDDRFELVLGWATAAPKAKPRPPAPDKREVTLRDGSTIARVQSAATGLTMTIPARTADGFDTWLAAEADHVLQELHDRWTQERAEDTDRQSK